MIDAEKANYTIVRMCRLLGVARSRYYEWRKKKQAGPSAREQRMAEPVEKVKAHHEASDGTYGAPRILHDLRDEGETVSRKTVAKAMRQAEIQGISPRRWHPPTAVHGPDPDPAPDLVQRAFDMGRRDAAWYSDITYLDTGEGWAYLCAIRDGHTRRVLGRTIADHLRADLVEDALRQAVALRGELPHKVIFHADRGTQGGFNWWSQHLDWGGVWWFVVSRPRIGRSGRSSGLLGIRSSSGTSRWSSGNRSPTACFPRKPLGLPAWRRRSGRGGSTTLAGWPRSISTSSPRAAF